MGKRLDVSSQNNAPRGVWLGDSGTKLFVLGIAGTDTIYRYTLSTAYDVSSGSFDSGQTLTSGSSSTGRMGLHMNPAGTKLYLVDNGLDLIRQWTLSTAWDLTSASLDGTYDVSGEDAGPTSVSFSNTGHKMYMAGAVNSTVYEYDLTTNFDVTGTVTLTANTHSLTETGAPNGIFFEDGTNDYFVANNYSNIYLYTMSTAWDVSSASYDTGNTFAFTEGAGNCYQAIMKSDGTELYVAADTNPEYINQYTLGTAWDLTTAYFDPPVETDGAVTLAQTVSATASTNHHRADGAVTLSPTIAATGRGTPHADGAVTVTPEVTATGTNATLHCDAAVTVTPEVTAAGRGTIHIDAGVSLNQTVSGTGALPPSADGEVTITPTVEATATLEVSMAVDITLPAMTSSGWIDYNLVSLPPMTVDAVMENEYPTLLTLPALTATGEMIGGNNYATDATRMILPALQVIAYSDEYSDIVLPALTASGTLTSSNNLSVDVRLPALQAAGTMGDARILEGDVLLPALNVPRGTLVNAPVIDADVRIPSLEAFGRLSNGTDIAVDIELPALEVDSVLISEGILTADLTLPAMEAVGYITFTVNLEHSGWSFNTESMRMSEYDNYNYLMLGTVFGKTIGVAADGIYELTGDTDNAVDINADVLFGLDSFRTEDLKRIKTVHLGYRADNSGDLNVQIVVDGEDKIREYIVRHVSSASGIKRGRATIAKGLKSRYWQYGVKNVAGADFLIDDLSVFVQQHNRKAQ